MRFETPLFPLSLHAAGLSIADDFLKVGSNDLMEIGLVNAVIDVVRSSPFPTSPEARIGSRRREGGQSEVATG